MCKELSKSFPCVFFDHSPPLCGECSFQNKNETFHMWKIPNLVGKGSPTFFHKVPKFWFGKDLSLSFIRFLNFVSCVFMLLFALFFLWMGFPSLLFKFYLQGFSPTFLQSSSHK